MTYTPSTVPGDYAVVLRAMSLALSGHATQTRRYSGEPYILHPLNVATMVATRTVDPHVIAAALLHDALEDTDITRQEIIQATSFRTLQLVAALTDHYTKLNYPDFNREQRKWLEADRLARQDADVQLIKAYDLLDNTRDIRERDPDFAPVYLVEARHLASKLTALDVHEKILLEQTLS